MNYIYNITKVHGNSKNATPRALPEGIPYCGPQFLPPTYTHVLKRDQNARLKPELAYLRPLNVVHPVYYDNLKQCPQCESTEVLWDSWTSTGHRKLHGIRMDENALGYQLRCKACERRAQGQSGGAGGAVGEKPIRHCFATTSAAFWQRHEHWEIPRKYALEFISSRTRSHILFYRWCPDLLPALRLDA